MSGVVIEMKDGTKHLIKNIACSGLRQISGANALVIVHHLDGSVEEIANGISIMMVNDDYILRKLSRNTSE